MIARPDRATTRKPFFQHRSQPTGLPSFWQAGQQRMNGRRQAKIPRPARRRERDALASRGLGAQPPTGVQRAEPSAGVQRAEPSGAGRAWKAALVGAAAALLLAGMSGCAASPETEDVAPEFIFRYAENQIEDYPTTQAARYFAEAVEERTGGRIQIEVCPLGELGDEPSVLEQLQFGGVDFTRVSLSSLAEVSSSLNVLQLPYLYCDTCHMWAVLDGEIGDAFLNSVSGSGLTGLSWFDSGARSFYAVREIRTLEDLAGLRIRVQESQLMMDMVKLLGAIPVPLPYGDVYSALKTGAVDGAENNWPSYESTGHYEAARYYLLDEHTRVPEMQLASSRTMNKLSEADQQIVRECARESAMVERSLWAEREHASETLVKQNGVTVVSLPPEEKQRFQQAVLPLYEAYAGPYQELVRSILDSAPP